MSPAAERVLVTGARPGMVEALAVLIARAEGVVVTAATFDELASADQAADATVAVVDVGGDPAEVAAAAEALRRRLPGLPLVALGAANGTAASLPPRLRATACLPAGADARDLVAAIHAAAGTGRRPGHPASPVPVPAEGGPLDHLTARERQVLAAVVTGAHNASIAEALGVSLHTVRTHLRHILLKLGVDNRVDAAIRARACGLVARDAIG